VPVVAGPCPEGLRAVARRRICSSDGGARGPGKGELRRMRGPPAGERWRWRGPTPADELRRRRVDPAAMAQIRPPPGSSLLCGIECGGGAAPARASSGGGAAPRRRASTGGGAAPRGRALGSTRPHAGGRAQAAARARQAAVLDSTARHGSPPIGPCLGQGLGTAALLGTARLSHRAA